MLNVSGAKSFGGAAVDKLVGVFLGPLFIELAECF